MIIDGAVVTQKPIWPLTLEQMYYHNPQQPLQDTSTYAQRLVLDHLPQLNYSPQQASYAIKTVTPAPTSLQISIPDQRHS